MLYGEYSNLAGWSTQRRRIHVLGSRNKLHVAIKQHGIDFTKYVETSRIHVHVAFSAVVKLVGMEPLIVQFIYPTTGLHTLYLGSMRA